MTNVFSASADGMTIQTAGNVVLVARELNVGEFTQLWLVEQGIVTRDECGPSSLFTPVAVSVNNPDFDLMVIQQRVQVTVKRDFLNAGPLVERVAGGIAEKSKGTSFHAVGFNLDFVYEPKGRGSAELSRRLCLRDDSPFANEFSDEKSEFGFRAQKPHGKGRLSLDVRPVKNSKTGEEGIQCRFNLHSDVESAKEIIENLKQWPASLRQVGEIVGRLASIESQHA